MSRTPRGAAGTVRHWAAMACAAVVVLAVMVVPTLFGQHRTLPVLGIVALGDSVASGYACDCTPFPQLMGDDLSGGGRSVAVYNEAANGYTVADVTAQVKNGAQLRLWLAQADVITLTVGANALSAAADKGPAQCPQTCWQPMVDANAAKLGELVKTLRGLQSTRHGKLAWTSYWNVFEDGFQGREVHGDAFIAWSDQITRYANQRYAEAVRANGGQVVDLYAPFKGTDGNTDPSELLAADGDHPNAAGHQLIATTIERRLDLAG